MLLQGKGGGEAQGTLSLESSPAVADRLYEEEGINIGREGLLSRRPLRSLVPALLSFAVTSLIPFELWTTGGPGEQKLPSPFPTWSAVL
ncbi:uncharacterized protein N7473_011205 [Penicillium subrubescens]|uniref:Uncharacterized protein n=1 Tax=Penicillium subrubescens TaxID=1316194 RepID=A0A1Q5TD03_9EURO|nr:uncharacterized protein N7473_013135 [Penicillium subrubescens]XP_057004266.1 uncharacterized protein N7473_011205 [Penicillium subrubescens]KAJ5875022.1 hypothetical protein N7473_013135 [Penicillium subrubescens]KAJ5882771.1 hypothetical protein N7473_011205 [Penicillium subrubescens]OKO98102.1 hypothetical protein PENSUB_9538 [Penicillium subrubescens]